MSSIEIGSALIWSGLCIAFMFGLAMVANRIGSRISDWIMNDDDDHDEEYDAVMDARY